MNDYYVYVYWRLDINEPFYVGKGHKDRWKRLDGRSKHFNNIINKTLVAVTIEKDNLTEEEAFYWEEEIIRRLVFEYGYSIDIPKNRSDEKGCHLINATWGGEGVSGCNPFENMTEEKKKERNRKFKESFSGENNPNYGKHLSEETRRKLSKSHKGKNCGEKHHFYGKHHTEETKRKISQNRKGKHKGKNNHLYGISKKGKDGIASKCVICLTTKRIFWTLQDGANYYGMKSVGNITSCCKGKRNYAGKYRGQKLKWKYLIWKHNKKYRVKVND